MKKRNAVNPKFSSSVRALRVLNSWTCRRDEFCGTNKNYIIMSNNTNHKHVIDFNGEVLFSYFLITASQRNKIYGWAAKT